MNSKFVRLNVTAEELKARMDNNSTKEVAASYGVTVWTIYQWMKKLGLKNPHKRGRPKGHPAQVDDPRLSDAPPF